MQFKKVASFYSIFIGIAMIGMWIFFYASGNIPELDTEPIRISMHILAEVITAVILILGGIGILVNKKWGKDIYLVSMGMLIYTLVQSPGYFMETGDYGFVIIFGVLMVLSITLTLKMLQFKNDYGLYS